MRFGVDGWDSLIEDRLDNSRAAWTFQTGGPRPQKTVWALTITVYTFYVTGKIDYKALKRLRWDDLS